MQIKNLLAPLASSWKAAIKRLNAANMARAQRRRSRALKALILGKPEWAQEFAFLVPLLERPLGAKPAQSITDEQYNKLFRGAHEAREAVAAASIVFKLCERNRRSVFEASAAALERVPLEIAADVSNSLDEFTILSGAIDGPQRKSVFAFAAALLSSPRCRKLHLVFTNEWDWQVWHLHGNKKLKSMLRKNFLRQIAHFKTAGQILQGLDARLNIVVSPTHEELALSMGSVVIRFEGPAHFKTTYLGGEAILAARPVVTATFSSVVEEGRNTDITLVRTKDLTPSQRYFIPPAAISQPVRPSTSSQYESRTIITAYAQERIKQGLARIPRQDWDFLARFFDRFPQARWLLVGAVDVEEADRQIPDDIRAKYRGNITVLGFSDLDVLFDNAVALLMLPATFGGGVTASMAIGSGVPVLVMTNPRSDVSNALPTSLHIKSFEDAVARIEAWLGNREAWDASIQAQQNSLRFRMDLRAKGEELLDILANAHAGRAATQASIAHRHGGNANQISNADLSSFRAGLPT